MLTASKPGCVLYYDLDARESVKRFLFLVQDRMECISDVRNCIRMSVDICSESAVLSFNLVGLFLQAGVSRCNSSGSLSRHNAFQPG